MKKSFLFISALATIVISCQKNGTGTIENNDSIRTIKAIVETEFATKTTYDKNGESYNFSWVSGDVVSVRLVKDNAGTPYFDRWEYKADATAAVSTLTASSVPSSEWSLSSYAFYPKPGTLGFNYTNDHSNAGPSIALSDFSVSQDNPYQVIPMIGVNKGDNTYSFKAATGVLKVTYTNLPASLEGGTLSLQLVTGQNGGTTNINGTCAFPSDEKTLAITSNGSNTKYISYTVTDPSEVSFYVPIPECTLAAKDIKFTLYNSSLGWFFDHFVNPKEITIERGVVSELPVIDFGAIQGSLSYTGNPGQPKITIKKGPRVAKVQYTVAKSESDGNTNLSNGTDVIELVDNGDYNITPATSGSYYIVCRMLNSKDELIASKSIPFAYVSSNLSEIVGTYNIANKTSSWSFVLAEETSEPGYNVKITQYNSNNSTYNSIAGNVYGILDAAAGTLTFPKGQKLSNGTTDYYVVGAKTINTGNVCVPDDNLVFNIQNIVGDSNKLVLYCSTKFGIVTMELKGTGQQFNPGYYYQQ